MSKLETGVYSITVEVEGRRLSFTFEEAKALHRILNDMFGESPVREYAPLPVYGPRPTKPEWPSYGLYSWEYQGDSGPVTFSAGNENGDVTTH